MTITLRHACRVTADTAAPWRPSEVSTAATIGTFVTRQNSWSEYWGDACEYDTAGDEVAALPDFRIAPYTRVNARGMPVIPSTNPGEHIARVYYGAAFLISQGTRATLASQVPAFIGTPDACVSYVTQQKEYSYPGEPKPRYRLKPYAWTYAGRSDEGLKVGTIWGDVDQYWGGVLDSERQRAECGTEFAGHLSACLDVKNFRNGAPWLVAADWLDERGEPQESSIRFAFNRLLPMMRARAQYWFKPGDGRRLGLGADRIRDIDSWVLQYGDWQPILMAFALLCAVELRDGLAPLEPEKQGIAYRLAGSLGLMPHASANARIEGDCMVPLRLYSQATRPNWWQYALTYDQRVPALRWALPVIVNAGRSAARLDSRERFLGSFLHEVVCWAGWRDAPELPY